MSSRERQPTRELEMTRGHHRLHERCEAACASVSAGPAERGAPSPGACDLGSPSRGKFSERGQPGTRHHTMLGSAR
jgi:hypothetical protein